MAAQPEWLALMDLASVRRAYQRYAPVYDRVFGPALNAGRIHTVRAVNRLPPATVLEVGVGTGLSLPRYRRDHAVVGIDISSEMLGIARRRLVRERLDNVHIMEMDAERLAFGDHTFDIVVAMYVMSVVPRPRCCLDEIIRVCRPGGTIFICNHFLSPDKARIARTIAPLGRWLGWRPDFTLSQLLGGSPLQVVHRRPLPPFGLFTLIECRIRAGAKK